MTFPEAVQFLISLSNLPRREFLQDPKLCNIYLKRLQVLLDILGNPERSIPAYIHITGTSGKGSVTQFLASILKAAGLRVGSEISPHLTNITERWCVDGQEMSKKTFTRLVEELIPKLDTYVRTARYDMPSFFEIMTAIDFLYFKEKKVDVAVLEVGLGGRYDSTNSIPHKQVAIITSIGRDHMEILGNTLKKIAYEKAGIIAKHTPVFTLETKPGPLSVIAKEAAKKRAPLTILRPTYTIKKMELSGTTFIYDNKEFRLNTIGVHQITNAILCIEVARTLGIDESAIKNGLAKALQPARMEVVARGPTIIIDGAHNEDKIDSSVETLLLLKKMRVISKHNRIHVLLGFSNNKTTRPILSSLARLCPVSVACTRNTMNPFRKVSSPGVLKKQIATLLPKASVEAYINPKDALASLRKRLL